MRPLLLIAFFLFVPTVAIAQTTCDTAGLTRSRSCAGPWDYQRFVTPCWAMKATQSCGAPIEYGTKQVPVYPRCRLEEHGLERLINEAFPYSEMGHKETKRICIEGRKPPCKEETFCVYDDDCQTNARAQFERHVPPSFRAGAGYQASETGRDGKRCRISCSIAIRNYPIFNERESSRCGPPTGTRTETDFSNPTKYPSCRHEKHGPAKGECGVDPARRYSRPDISLEQLSMADDLAVVSPAPSCLTCDELPLQTAADVQAKFACLTQHLAAVNQHSTVDRVALEARLVEKLKLLYELKGDQLSAPSRDVVVALYRSAPSALPACGLASTVPEVAASCPTGVAARDMLRYCARLALPHVPREVALLGLGACASVGEAISGLGASEQCRRGDLARAYLQTSETLLGRALVRPVQTVGDIRAPAIEEVRTQLDVLMQWYRTAKKTSPLVEGHDLDEAVARTVAQVWSSAHARGESLVGVSRDRIAEVALETDRLLLEAALEVREGDRARLQGGPLLAVLAEGFRGLAERTRAMTSAHDVGCMVVGCARGAFPTAAGQLWGAWANLSNPDGMRKAVTAADRVPAEWRRVLDLAAQRSRDIQEAIAAVTPAGRVVDLAVADGRALAPTLRPLAELVREGHARSTMEWRTGMLAETDVDALRLGLQESKHEAVKHAFAERRVQLGAFVRDYLAHETQYLSTLVAELRGQADTTAVVARLRSRAQEYEQLSADMVGLRQSALLEEIRFGTLAESLREAAQLDEDAGSQIQRKKSTLMVSARDARFFSSQQSLDTLVVESEGRNWELPVSRGDVVHLGTTGAWSPTCALEKSGGVDLGGQRVSVDASGALIGPEGFMLQRSNDKFVATSNRMSNRTEQFSGTTESASMCAGASLTAGGFFAQAFGVSVYVSAQACASADSGRRSTSARDSESSHGVDARQAAQFSTGLRVPGTPFPQLPAGALIAVFRPATGSPTAHVVPSPSLAMVAPADGRLQLVVNDADCSAASDRSLSVEIVHMEHVGATAKRVGNVMGDILGSIRAERERLLLQGRILPAELAVLRERAHHAMRVGTGVADLPPVLAGLFSGWLESSLLMLQRDIEIQAVDRARQRLELELEVARTELASAEGAQRLASRITRTSLRNVDTERLAVGVGSVAEVARRYLQPVLDLRYPKTLERLRDPGRIDTFRNLARTDPRRSALDVARDIEAATQLMFEQWELVKLEERELAPELPVVAVAFPHPDRAASSDWSAVDPERAKRLWAQLSSPDAGEVTLEIRPEDLYARGGPARLQCSEVVPVIRSMAVYLAVDEAAADTLNIQNWRLVGNVDPRLTFTTANGPRVYQLHNADWLSDQMRVLFGPTDFAPDVFTKFGKALRIGHGLSPFTRFQVDFTPLRRSERRPNPLDVATELVVVFEIERQSVAPPGVRGVASCPPAVAPPPGPVAGGGEEPLRWVRPAFRIIARPNGGR